jgi:hypothetical protein
MVLGDMPVACPVSRLLPKILHLLKNFLRTLGFFLEFGLDRIHCISLPKESVSSLLI